MPAELQPDQPGHLLGAGNVHLQQGELLQALQFHERCARLQSSCASTDVAFMAARKQAEAALVTAATAMQLAAEAAIAASDASRERAPSPLQPAAEGPIEPAEPAAEERQGLPPGCDYSSMSMEDKVDALRMQLPSRSSTDLRSILGKHGGDIHKAFAFAAARR